MSDLNGFTFKNYVSMVFVAFAVIELMEFFFFKGGTSSIEAMVIFLIIAVIFSYFRAFLVFIFYFFVVSLIVIIASMVIGYAIGINITNIGTKVSGMEFLYWSLGTLTATIAISAFLTKRTRDKEKEFKPKDEETPNPDDFGEDNEEEQRKREQEAYERGRRSGEEQGKKMTRQEAYAILGLENGATQEQVKQAYRKIGKKIHPDATGINTNRLMQKVNEAYEKLTGDDESERKL